MKKNVFIIGGAAVDISGWPDTICRLRDSNLGTVRISTGGVGKNIAKYLVPYGLDVELVTAIGKGYHAQIIENDCKTNGVKLNYTLSLNEHTGTFLCVLDEDGDLQVGISDMKIIDHITPQYCETLLPKLNAADMLVLDSNLMPETLAYLTQHVTVPIYYDPVSCAKANRIEGHVGKCFAIKPNRYEATFLSGKSCDTLRGLYRASDWFLEQGVQRVFISLGPEGVFWADNTGNGVLPSTCMQVVDTTGAGDAMSAAIINGCLNGLSTEECANAGNEASAIVCGVGRIDLR